MILKADKSLDRMLDAAATVVARQGIANLTLDAVAAEIGMSKGGLLHHFPSKDRLVQALVTRSAEGWRAHYTQAYEQASEGPGRMARGLMEACLSYSECWTQTGQVQQSSSACFAALAQNPDLIEPMRAAYSELIRRVSDDGLPEGVGETIAAAIDGLWLYSVLGLVKVDQALVNRVRGALEALLAHSLPAPKPAARRKAATKTKSTRAGARRSKGPRS